MGDVEIRAIREVCGGMYVNLQRLLAQATAGEVASHRDFMTQRVTSERDS